MKRRKFSLSNYKLLTADMGQLIPVNVTEVLPGDTIQQATSMLLRVSPLVAPVMHPVQVKVHHWYVPFSLIWEDFEKFITGGEDGLDASVPPYATGQFGTGSLGDYLGIPSTPAMSDFNYSVLPFRAYHLIYNEFYRDQDLQTKHTILKTSGLDATDYNLIHNACWEKDYFTSARPHTQKGAEVSFDMLNSDPVVQGTIPGQDVTFNTNMSSSLQGGLVHVMADTEVNPITGQTPDIDLGNELTIDHEQFAAVTVNQLREAMALQRYAEARSKYGSRYSEYLRYLGVKSSDGRLSRPEYLGGGKNTIQFSEVLQTGPEAGGGGVGNLAGHGIAAMRSNRYRRFFEEHGLIISLMIVKPKTMYMQGLHKMWTRQTKEDFYQRELENIGQAEVYGREIFLAGQNRNNVFGYQDRYDEYRRQESMIHGEFRENLDHWHMARIFATEPVLNSEFVTAQPTKRIHADTQSNTLWVMVNNSIQARRMIGGGQ